MRIVRKVEHRWRSGGSLTDVSDSSPSSEWNVRTYSLFKSSVNLTSMFIACSLQAMKFSFVFAAFSCARKFVGLYSLSRSVAAFSPVFSVMTLFCFSWIFQHLALLLHFKVVQFMSAALSSSSFQLSLSSHLPAHLLLAAIWSRERIRSKRMNEKFGLWILFRTRKFQMKISNKLCVKWFDLTICTIFVLILRAHGLKGRCA